MYKMLPRNMLAHIYTHTEIHTQSRKHKSRAYNAYLLGNLLSTCSRPQPCSISVLCQAVIENMDQWRDETVRKHRAGGDEEQMEKEEEEA